MTPLRKRIQPSLSAWSCVAALPLLLSACSQPAGGPPGGGGMPPASVAVITAEQRDVPVRYEYVAQTAGFREVEVRARVTGILQQRSYREGNAVNKGQTLFMIDAAPFQVALAKAEADLSSAEVRLTQAKRELARLKPVLEARAISQKELDDSASTEQVANAEVQSARARVNEARLNLSYTRVDAPIAGIAGRPSFMMSHSRPENTLIPSSSSGMPFTICANAIARFSSRPLAIAKAFE